jgi:hypothetical protein
MTWITTLQYTPSECDVCTHDTQKPLGGQEKIHDSQDFSTNGFVWKQLTPQSNSLFSFSPSSPAFGQTQMNNSLIIWVVIMNNPRLTWGYPNNPPQIPGLLWFPTMKNVTESSFREVNIPFYPHVLVTTTHYYCLNDKIFLYCQLHNVSGYIPWYSFTNSARPCRGGSFQNSNDDMKLYNGI